MNSSLFEPSPLLRTVSRIAFALGVAIPAFCLTGNLSAAPPEGRLLSAQCFQCHGTDGRAVGGFESIVGESEREMFNELLEMSQRPPEGIMDLQARGFTREQLQKIAAYLATLPNDHSNEGFVNGGGSDPIVNTVQAQIQKRKAKKRRRRARQRRKRRARRNRQ